MPGLLFDVPDARAGSAWLAREGRARQNELLVALLSRFNHDLRTPLNTVVGWTHLLQQGMVDSARSRHVADVLARNTREQVVMLDEFVDDARAVLGAMKLDPVALGVDELVAQATERAAPVATLTGVTFDVRLADGTGPVEGDERRLKRLVYRLLAAVTRRTREGGVVQVASRGDGGGVLLTIEATAGRDWPEATVLDLQLSSFVAALHDAELTLDGTPERAGIALRLPLRP
jgi:signal transduction histidine kinase